MTLSSNPLSRVRRPNPKLNRRRALGLGGGAAIASFALRTASIAAQEESTPGSLFPENRVLLYYGFPTNENMGILGEFEPGRVLELIEAEAENYRTADPDRPVKVGFEMIASVAQASPGDDGKYIADASRALLDQYTQFTADNGILLFFDIQMGFREPDEDYEGLEEWMAEPHVHLGIDPEFHMRGDEVPGIHIGQVTAAEVTAAQNWLAGISETYNVPPKTLIVHQFDFSMIEEKDQIEPVDGVDLVIDMDGFGPPDQKEDTYRVVITEQPIEYHGIKLFYEQDVPLMTAEEVLAFDPSPDLIIYQ